MKNRFSLSCILLLAAAVASPTDAAAIDDVTVLGLVPQPRRVKILGGMRPVAEPSYSSDSSLPVEGYRLAITRDGVKVLASSDAGRFYAMQTLRQLVRVHEGIRSYPCVEIDDSPAFGWRGLLLDESRHFFGTEVVKRFIDLMAEHKLNVFHWHLTDSIAWRLQIDAWPKLTEQGSKVCVWSDADRYYRVPKGTKPGTVIGPDFYTKAQIRDIVAYAAARHVRIVPEIDVPGHSEVAMRCYPDLKCIKAPETKNMGVHDLCLGNQYTYRFYEKVFDEVCAMFPGEYIHIGGDEAQMKNWKQCPRCQAFVREHALQDDGRALQHSFTKHFADYLAKKGRRVVGWSEIAHGGPIPKNAAVMSWLGKDPAADVVFCPAGYFYFDYEQDLVDDPVPNYFWGWATSLERAYSFNGASSVSPESRHRVLGGQANSWTEMTLTEEELEWKVWPRACAVAELFWTDPKPAEKDFAKFAARVEADRTRMSAQGVNVAPISRIDPVRDALKPWIVEGPFFSKCRIAGAVSRIRRPEGTMLKTYVGWQDAKNLVKTSTATPTDSWVALRIGDSILYLNPKDDTKPDEIAAAQESWRRVVARETQGK